MPKSPFEISSTPPADDSHAGPDMPGTLGDAAPDETGTGLTLTADQVKAAGLDSLEEGDSFTVTITGTVTTSDPEEGITASVEDASEGEKNDGGIEPGGSEEQEPAPKFAKPKSSMPSPREAGFL